jgi:epoxyqueuosine reductase QueG
MNKQEVVKLAKSFIETSADNYLKKEISIAEAVVGMKIFDDPIFAIGDAEDEYFVRLKNPVAIGSHFKLPKEWLPQGRTVMSFFLPYTEAVKRGNSQERTWPAPEWLHGRYEGQMLLNKLSRYLQAQLESAGYPSVALSLDKSFWVKTDVHQDISHDCDDSFLSFTSNWSERHVAFVCGLGTFGLSKGLITVMGMAGRFGSIVTELELAPDKREYVEYDEYCSMCGACSRQCPVNAISMENGKDHQKCSDFLTVVKAKYKPRYGCGKCQVAVPCASSIPSGQ